MLALSGKDGTQKLSCPAAAGWAAAATGGLGIVTVPRLPRHDARPRPRLSWLDVAREGASLAGDATSWTSARPERTVGRSGSRRLAGPIFFAGLCILAPDGIKAMR